MHASGASGRAAAALTQSTGFPLPGLVSTESLPGLLPAHALLDGPFPPVGPVGLTAPPASVRCAATTALCPSRVASLVARFPLPCVLPSFVVSLTGSCPGGSTQDHARAFGPPVPPSGFSDKATGGSPPCPRSPSGDLPRSQPPGVSCALALTHPGRRPSSAGKPSAFPSIRRKDILLSTTLPVAGLHDAACLLAPPGFVRPLAGRHAGALLTGWRGFDQVGLEP